MSGYRTKFEIESTNKENAKADFDKARDILQRLVAWFNGELTVDDIESGQDFAKQALDLNSIVNDAEEFLDKVKINSGPSV